MPRLEIVNRGADSSLENFPMTLRVRGQTKKYWYFPAYYSILPFKNPYTGEDKIYQYDVRPDLSYNFKDLKGRKCPCAPATPPILDDQWGQGDGYYTYHGAPFFKEEKNGFRKCNFLSDKRDYYPVDVSGWSHRTWEETEDPNDCYFEIASSSNVPGANKKFYYRVKKIPVIHLEEIFHNDTNAFRNYEYSVKQESVARNEYERVKTEEIETPKLINKWRIYYRYDYGKERIDLETDNFGKIVAARYGNQTPAECPCSKNGKICIVGDVVPWDVYSCYEKYKDWNKPWSQLAEEDKRKDRRVQSARKSYFKAFGELQKDSGELLEQNRVANIAREKGEYYPYKVYEPGVDPPVNSFDFISTYDGQLLPTAKQAYKVKNEQEIWNRNALNFGYGAIVDLRYTPTNCNINGHFDNIEIGWDNKGRYTDYTLTMHGNPRNKISDIKKSAEARRIQAVAVPTQLSLSGAECRLQMTPHLFDFPVTYYFSTGDVDMPPIRIQSFKVSVEGKTSNPLGECSADNYTKCLPKEKLPSGMESSEAFFTDGRTPLRSKRSAPANTTLEIETKEKETFANVNWNVTGMDDVNGIVVTVVKHTQDINHRVYDIANVVQGGTGSYTSQLKPGDCKTENNKQTCSWNTYSFFLTAVNDRAVTDSDRLKYNEDNIQYVWAASQKIDVKVKKEELAIPKFSVKKSTGKKDSADLEWKTTGAEFIRIEMQYSWGRKKSYPQGDKWEDGTWSKDTNGSVTINGIDTRDTVFTLFAQDNEGNTITSNTEKLGDPKEVNIIDVVINGLGLRNRLLNRSLYEIITDSDCPDIPIVGDICRALSFNNIWRTVGGLVTKVIPGLGDLVGMFLNFLKEPVVAIFGVIMEIVDNFVIQKNTVKGAAESINEFIGGFLREFIPNFIAGAAEGVFNKLMGDCVGSKMGGWINIGVQALYSGVGGLLQLIGKIPLLGGVGKIGESMTSACPVENSGCTIGICAGQDTGKEIGKTVLEDVISGLLPFVPVTGALDSAKKFIEPMATTIFPECKNTVPKERQDTDAYACISGSCQKAERKVEICGLEGGGGGAYPNKAACLASCGIPPVTTEVKYYYKCNDPSTLTCDKQEEKTEYEGDAGLYACNLTCKEKKFDEPTKDYFKCINKNEGQCRKVEESTTYVGLIGKAACDITCKKTGVGCGCPKHPEYLTTSEIGKNPLNRKRAIANVLMTTVYVSTGGVFCVRRDAAYNCAEILDKAGKADDLIKLGRDNNWDVSQKKESIDRSVFTGLYEKAKLVPGCAAFIAIDSIKNFKLPLCEQEITNARCEAITSEDDCR
ncbi:hypothetical protein HY623_01370 [Candidatus Uhrbacteria bacterium]|nr:hypothetical protein [Candidatus Uhrbacteria bacterium]